MKVWARYAVPVMVLVDEHKDEIERVVMVPDERFIDRETMGDMLFYTEQLERISSSQPQAAHALYVADYDRWPDPKDELPVPRPVRHRHDRRARRDARRGHHAGPLALRRRLARLIADDEQLAG